MFPAEEWLRRLTPADIANLDLLKATPASLWTFLQNLQSELRMKAMSAGKPYQDWELYRAVAEAVFENRETPIYRSEVDIKDLKEENAALSLRLKALEEAVRDLREDKQLADADWGQY